MKFTHIYVEEKLKKDPAAARILARFPKAQVIYVRHYKDVFNRSHQSFMRQKAHQALILAKKEGQLIYEGAPVCQNFGNYYFYYTSCMMNCIFDCEYCYLQGMYPSGNIVLFVNLEDIFEEVRRLLTKHPVYLCISYDTDLLAVENMTGFVKAWCAFARQYEQLTVEIRTKSAAFDQIRQIEAPKNVILAWSVSPEVIARQYEHFAAPTEARLLSAKTAWTCGWRIRLCLEPLLYIQGWQDIYGALIRRIFEIVPPHAVTDMSVGEFRVSVQYLKTMRRQRPGSADLFYPYTADRGVYHYDRKLSESMLSFVTEELKKYISKQQIYLWSEKEEIGE